MKLGDLGSTLSVKKNNFGFVSVYRLALDEFSFILAFDPLYFRWKRNGIQVETPGFYNVRRP